MRFGYLLAASAALVAAAPAQAAIYYFGFDGTVQNSTVPGLADGSSFTIRVSVLDPMDFTGRGTRIRSSGWSSVELISGDFRASGAGQFYYSLNPATGITQILSFGGMGLGGGTNDTNTSLSVFVGADRFEGVGSIVNATSGPPVPEPATWAMMIAGFGLVGAGMRRSSIKAGARQFRS